MSEAVEAGGGAPASSDGGAETSTSRSRFPDWQDSRNNIVRASCRTNHLITFRTASESDVPDTGGQAGGGGGSRGGGRGAASSSAKPAPANLNLEGGNSLLSFKS